MRLIIGMVVGLLVSMPVLAHEVPNYGLEFTGGYDYYLRPNGGNNYDDGQGFSAGIKHPIAGPVSGRLQFSHITDVHFPTSDDPKGSFGELRGTGGTYDILFSLPATESVDVYLFGGAGYYSWDFRENPFLQDNQVTVDVDAGLALKGGAGVSYETGDWTLAGEVSWFDAAIGKEAVDSNGLVWQILDADNEINLRYIGVSAKAEYRF